MLSYVVAASKNGQPLSDAAVARLDVPEPQESFFEPEDRLAWLNASRTIGFFGWQAGASMGGMISHWHEHGRRLTAFSGHPYLRTGWRRDASWAEQAAATVRGTSLEGGRDRFLGSSTLVDINPAGGRVVADPFGVCILFRAENDEVVAISNRATLAARAVRGDGHAAPRNAAAVGWLPYFGYIIGRDTGIVGVDTLPADELVRFDAAGNERRVSASAPVWRFPGDVDVAAGDREELLDAVLDELVAHVRAAARVQAPKKTLRLSGGKDSRLLLALIAKAGVQDEFDFLTLGPDHAPDVVVAKSIASELGIDLDVKLSRPPNWSAEQFERKLRSHVFQTAGMLNPWHLKAPLRTSPNLGLAGTFGELLRSHYAPTRTQATESDVRSLFAALHDGAGALLTDEARVAYRDAMTEYVEQQLAAEDPQNVADIFYVDNRIRRWLGTAQEINAAHPAAAPLQTVLGTRTAFALGHRSRQVEAMHLELTRRASERLAKIPFAQQKWHPESYKHLRDADDYAKIEPYRGQRGAPVRWQETHWETTLPVLRDYLASPTNPVYEILDHGRVMEALDGQTDLPLRQKNLLYGALGAAMWLGRAETAERVRAQ